MGQRVAAEMGIDLSTTKFSVGVRRQGAESVHDQESWDFESIDVRGGASWLGQPAFNLEFIPAMFEAALAALRARDWTFDSHGAVSFSVRQHDMTLLNRGGGLLMPALSWQCNAARKEVEELTERGLAGEVGKIEARFILPKLLWALRQSPGGLLAKHLRYVCTTGDYIAWQLTGQWRLSSSDALSNGLLAQATKELATQTLRAAELDPAWFPPVIQSGKPVGLVAPGRHGPDPWTPIRETLAGWTVTAGLGDNHAGAVGCGLADERTIVISAGSSGTVTRMTSPQAQLHGQAVQFEFYRERLLLLMLADCAVWYDRFVKEFVGENPNHPELDAAALAVDPARIVRVTQAMENDKTLEVYPALWAERNQAERVASTQYSIALELLRLVRVMLAEVEGGPPIERFALTGGLSQAPLFRGVLVEGLRHLAPAAPLFVSDRTDKLAFQTATYGALINAMLRGELNELPRTAGTMCPTRQADSLPGDRAAAIRHRLAADLQ